MRIPEIFFPVINLVVGTLLRSPFHGLLSGSLMIIHFRGRNSGREFATPVRYNQVNNIIHCFTAKTNNWWKNIRDGEEVKLVLCGETVGYIASVIVAEPERIRTGIIELLINFPMTRHIMKYD